MTARRLGLEFKDADAEIEQAAGRSVPEIFAEYGEEEFRRLEERVIERVLSEGPVLLALGGGAFMAEGTRNVIAGKSISVWLKADLEILLKRVLKRPGKRPLLSKGNPREILKDLLLVREPVYGLADLHVTSKGGTKAEMRDHVLAALDLFLKEEVKHDQ